jgi:hypothetical protein
MHGSFPAVQVQKNLWTAIPNAVLPTRSMLRDLSGSLGIKLQPWKHTRDLSGRAASGSQTKVMQTMMSNVLITIGD